MGLKSWWTTFTGWGEHISKPLSKTIEKPRGLKPHSVYYYSLSVRILPVTG